MDLGAVKAASRPDLLACVAAAAENTQGLLNDAELLSAAGQHARAYSLAVLAVEERSSRRRMRSPRTRTG